MKCIYCQGNKFKTLYVGKDWLVEKCRNCSLTRTIRDSDIQNYQNYHRDEDYSKFETYFANIFQKRINLIKRYIEKPGRILEIGCSTGGMLSLFKNVGWETWGVEPSRSARLISDKAIKLLRTTFEEANLPKNYFDLVVANHTLEHIENPMIVLKKINSILKPGGIVFIDIPNFDSLSLKILGKHWPLLLPLEHNFQFNFQILRKMLIKSGFSVIHQESRSGLFEFANPIKELWQALTGMKKRFITDILGFPGALIATLFNRGSSLSVIGVKSN